MSPTCGCKENSKLTQCLILYLLCVVCVDHHRTQDPDFLTLLLSDWTSSLSVTSCLWLSARSSLVPTEDLNLLKLPANKQINRLFNSDSKFWGNVYYIIFKAATRNFDLLCELVLNVRERKIFLLLCFFCKHSCLQEARRLVIISVCVR